ncbi:glycosylated lysosomal membrane protein [Geospiza fortis]|uniref:Glycosylated lysosomal membrane protein n=1 Tax=Geospiza fortis TaxID=48883 RepID=A0A6I9Z922_GEOFO|nr:glycosylated lysosomal membrane protein [Geospiza fortis]
MSHPPVTLGLFCQLRATPSPVPAPQVSMEYNPGWNSSSVNLLHVRAVGPGDSLHYVWSSIGAPSVLLVATRSPSSALRVNWTQLLSPSPAGAVWIDPPDSVVYSSAVVFTKLFEFSEAKPLGALFYPTYDLSEFSWDSLNHTLNHTALTAELRGVPATDPGGAFANGSLAFRVWAGGLQAANGSLPGASLLRAFFGDSLATSCTLSVLNVSFGGEEGHVYQERRYLSWSVLLGFGEPPRDTFSPLVISITAVALGTPLAMLLLGSCLVLLAQRRRYSEYEPIN